MAKIFVGGVNRDTSDEAFKTFFQQFGDIEDAVVMRVRATGTSRGFGFVTFVNISSVGAVLGSKTPLELDGRVLDCKSAVPKQEMDGQSQRPPQQRTKKIFVGGLSPATTESEFINYFSKFGSVAEATIMLDHGSKRPRGFGFIIFDSEDSVEEVIRTQLAGNPHSITNKVVECKKAVPKSPEQRYGAPFGGHHAGHTGHPYANGGPYAGGYGAYGPQYGAAYGAYSGAYGGGYNGGYAPPPNPSYPPHHIAHGGAVHAHHITGGPMHAAHIGPPAHATDHGHSHTSYQPATYPQQPAGFGNEYNAQPMANGYQQSYGRSQTPTRAANPAPGSDGSSRHHPYR